jgi:hypothetical protein
LTPTPSSRKRAMRRRRMRSSSRKPGTISWLSTNGPSEPVK